MDFPSLVSTPPSLARRSDLPFTPKPLYTRPSPCSLPRAHPSPHSPLSAHARMPGTGAVSSIPRLALAGDSLEQKHMLLSSVFLCSSCRQPGHSLSTFCLCASRVPSPSACACARLAAAAAPVCSWRIQQPHVYPFVCMRCCGRRAAMLLEEMLGVDLAAHGLGLARTSARRRLQAVPAPPSSQAASK